VENFENVEQDYHEGKIIPDFRTTQGKTILPQSKPQICYAKRKIQSYSFGRFEDFELFRDLI
jgi:hypothetical protein